MGIPGIFTDKEIRELFERGYIFSERDAERILREKTFEDQIGAACLDLTFSDSVERLVIRPGDGPVRLPLNEQIVKLPDGVSADFDRRSSYGAKTKVSAAVVGENGESVNGGYRGPLWADVESHVFPIGIEGGQSIPHMRFAYGEPEEYELKPRDVLKNRPYWGNYRGRIRTDEEGNLVMTLRLKGRGGMGFKAKKTDNVVNLSRVNPHGDSWEKIYSTDELALEPGDFVILKARQGIHIGGGEIPFVAEMPYTFHVDAEHDELGDGGELEVCGGKFLQYGSGDSPRKSRQAVEIYAERPWVLRDKQPICNLKLYGLVGEPSPEKVYAGGAESNLGSTLGKVWD